MTAAGKSKFWKIKSKEKSNHLRIESKWAQFDLEARDSRTLMYTDYPSVQGQSNREKSVDLLKAIYFTSD